MASTAPATAAAPKTLTVIEGMESRRVFSTIDLATNYLNDSATRFSDFESHPLVTNGLTSDGELDPNVYTPLMRVMVAVLANRGAKKGDPSTVKAIVVTPIPTLDSVLADPAAREWLSSKVLDKELNHVAVRALRNADDVESVQDQMPLTLADYISSSRESTGGIMETFNSLFKGIIASIGAKSVPWAKRRFTKAELKKALESKAYALEVYPEIEDRGDNPKTGKPFPSLFVMANQLGIREAEKAGLDPAIFNKWLAERDTKVFTAAQAADESDDFDLDDLAFEEEAATTDKPVAEPTPTPEVTA